MSSDRGDPERHGGAGVDPSFHSDPSDGDYAAAARRALEAEDFCLALEQVAVAVALRPQNALHLELLDRILRVAPTPLELTRLPAGAFYGLCAVRARALAHARRFDEAIDLLFQATAYSPETAFLPWADGWVQDAAEAGGIQVQTLAAGAARFFEALRGRHVDSGAAQNLESTLRALGRMHAPDPQSTSLLVLQSRALRLLGRENEAIARLAPASEASWEVAAELSAIHRQRHDFAAQARCLEAACALSARETSLWLDLGDAHVNNGGRRQALGAYERALVLDPGCQWASVSAAYARALGSTGAAACVELGAAQVHGEAKKRSQVLTADLCAYTTRVSDPVDPIVTVLRRVAADAEHKPSEGLLNIRVFAERPLAPSANIAFMFLLSAQRRIGHLLVEPERHTASMGPLWSTNGDELVPQEESGDPRGSSRSVQP